MSRLSPLKQKKDILKELESLGFGEREFSFSPWYIRSADVEHKISDGIWGVGGVSENTFMARIMHVQSKRLFSFTTSESNVFTKISFTLTHKQSKSRTAKDQRFIHIKSRDWGEVLYYFKSWALELRRQLEDKGVTNAEKTYDLPSIVEQEKETDPVSAEEKEVIAKWLRGTLIEELRKNASYFSEHFDEGRKTQLLQLYVSNTQAFNELITNNVEEMTQKLDAATTRRDYFSMLLGFISVTALSAGGWYWGFNEILSSLATSWTLWKNGKDGLKSA